MHVIEDQELVVEGIEEQMEEPQGVTRNRLRDRLVAGLEDGSLEQALSQQRSRETSDAEEESGKYEVKDEEGSLLKETFDMCPVCNRALRPDVEMCKMLHELP